MEPKAFETAWLHSPQCLDLLVRARDKAEKNSSTLQVPAAAAAAATTTTKTTTRSSTFEFFDQSSDDEEHQHSEEDSDSDSSSSSSSSSSSVKNGDSTPVAEAPVATTPQPRATAKSRAKDPKQRQRDQQIKHHAMNLNRTSFLLEDTRAIHLPTALLTRQQQQSSLEVEKCRAFCDLASRISSSKQQQQQRPVIVLLLRSGRFAAAVFKGPECIQHTSSQRYTVRKGQGKAQSSQDGRRRPKSMGSQLRRAGEQSLKEDIHATLQEWKEYIQRAGLILVSCPKTMRSTLFELESILPRNDPRLCSIPFDVGRPSFEAACIVHGTMMTVLIGEPNAFQERPSPSPDDHPPELADDDPVSQTLTPVKEEAEAKQQEEKETQEIIPLTDLHMAARDGNLAVLLDLLRDQTPDGQLTTQPAGYDFMTPLHFAAESTSNVDPVTAAACVSTLLIQGHADPTQVDARLRLPYFLASHEKTREAFRKARAILGEDYCDWEQAKVGPPLTDEDIRTKKEKEAEKKRRKKAKQKEKNAKDKAQAEELEKRRQEQEQREKEAEDARRARDALPAKAVRADNVCDFCQLEVKGRKRLQMFKRLGYNYCSSECVQKHKRELMAKAAMERFK